MPCRANPVLSLAVDNISKIDKVDCERLSSLWTVFTKCAENLENGRRLENLSWRLWYRECQLVEGERAAKAERNTRTGSTERQKRQRTCSANTVPSLSSSVQSSSTVDELSEEHESSTRPALHRTNSKGPHLTPNRFHELVTQFGQKQDSTQDWQAKQRRTSVVDDVPHVQVSHDSAASSPDRHAAVFSDEDESSDETTDVVRDLASTLRTSLQPRPSQTEMTADAEVPGVLRRASSVVHGFNPDCVSIKQPCALDELANHANKAPTGKNMFFIESSPSESDNDDAMPSNRREKKLTHKHLAPALKSSVSPDKPQVKKHTSFKEIVDEASDYDSSPFDSDSDEDEAHDREDRGDSAIISDDEEDDGDDDEWDSVCSESRPPSPSNDNMFDKVGESEGRPGLTSRKSILSTLLTNPMTRLSNAQSKSSPAISQSRQVSPTETPRDKKNNFDTGIGMDSLSSAKAQPTAIKGSVSPRTTRRNMLATELSESLRRHLLWERKQKSSTNINAAANAVLQRRHTTLDLTKMQKFPDTSTSLESRVRPEAIADNEFGYNGAGW